MGRRRREKWEGTRAPGGFIPLPKIVLGCEQFASLSAHAVKLLLDLLLQYRGNNNGDLCATWTMMKKRGWRSKDTLDKARRELLSGRWIALTRQGGLHAPSLYGVTFFSLNEAPKLELNSREFPFGAWATTPPQKRNVQPARRVTNERIDTPNGAQAAINCAD
jgi:hypothetical protein